MTTAAEAAASGFATPKGNEPLSSGDNAITQNAIAAVDLVRDYAYGSPLGTADLNKTTTAGDYYQQTDSNATSALNYPVARAGRLRVEPWNSNGGVLQTYTPWSVSGIYLRRLSGSTWGTWGRIPTEIQARGYASDAAAGALSTAKSYTDQQIRTIDPATLAPAAYGYTDQRLAETAASLRAETAKTLDGAVSPIGRRMDAAEAEIHTIITTPAGVVLAGTRFTPSAADPLLYEPTTDSSTPQDTGTRLLPVAAPATGNLYARRIGNLVHLTVDYIVPGATGTVVVANVPSGLRPARAARGLYNEGDTKTRVASVFAGSSSTLSYSGVTNASAWTYATLSYFTNDPWPATLPGTAA